MAPVTATIETARDANEKAVQSTLLNPRFYTTDFAAMDRIDVEPVRKEWDLMMQEYEGDNNHDHFQRDAQPLPRKSKPCSCPNSLPRCVKSF